MVLFIRNKYLQQAIYLTCEFVYDLSNDNYHYKSK